MSNWSLLFIYSSKHIATAAATTGERQPALSLLTYQLLLVLCCALLCFLRVCVLQRDIGESGVSASIELAPLLYDRIGTQ